MLPTSSEYLAAITAPTRWLRASFTVNQTTYREDKIVNMQYDSAVASGTDFVVGGGYINSLEASLRGIVEGLENVMPAEASVGEKTTNTDHPLGRFFITEVELDRNNKTTKIKLQDEFCLLGGAYKSKLQMPTTARKVFAEIVQLTRVSTVATIAIADDPIKKIPDKISYREAIIYIAQLNASYARFNRQGKLEFCKLVQTTRRITRDMYSMTALKKAELPYRLKGIECTTDEGGKKKTLVSGKSADAGNIMQLKNPFMTQAIIDRLYNELRYFTFYPYDITWRGDMALEAGDLITIENGDGHTFNAPMLAYKLTFNGGLSAKSEGRAVSQKAGEYAYKGKIQQQIDYLDELVTSRGSMYMEAEEPHDPHDGDKWFKPAGGYVEMLEYVDGQWIKRANTADLDQIVNTMTTDQVIAKKIYAAIASFIEINAGKIVAGDIDLQRLRVMNGLKEIMTVRDGKVYMRIENLMVEQKPVATNADIVDLLTQIDTLTKRYEAEEDRSKKTSDDMKNLTGSFSSLQTDYASIKEQAEKTGSLEAAQLELKDKIRELAETAAQVGAHMSFNDKGLTIGREGSPFKVQIDDDQIAFFDGDAKVAYISNNRLFITSGVFVSSLEVGNHKIEKMDGSNEWTIISWTGGAI